jgi:hypothetical protein
MTFNRRFLYGGIFLVTAGAAMLVAQSDAVSDDVVTQALRLWPVALIGLGIGLLLRRTRYGLAGGMLAAAMPGLLLGGLVVSAPRIWPDCGIVRPVTSATRQGAFDGPASVDLRLACGDLTVTTAPGNGWLLEAGNTNGAQAAVDASADRLSIASSGRQRFFDLARGGDAWQLSLPVANRLDLTAEVDAGRGRFDLAGAQLGDVRLAVNAGDARVNLAEATLAHLSMRVNAASASLHLPATSDYSADLSVNAGSLSVCATSDLGLRIHTQTVLASAKLNGLIRDGDAWESPGYATALHHADLAITANVGSVDVNPMGGCQ